MSTMSYGTDVFEFRAQSFLETTQPIDLTDETSVLGFEIAGSEPVGTNRRIIFEVDGGLFYFKSGSLMTFPYEKTFDDVLEYGSTTRDLAEVTSIPQWCGKKIYPIIALDAPKSAPVMPAISIKIIVNSYNDIYERTIFSPIFKLKLTGTRGKIISCVANPVVTGKATCVVFVRLKNNDVWGDWILPSAANNQYATEIQFKAVQIVTTLDGTDSASIDGVKISYTTDCEKISESPAEIITLPQTSDVDLHRCELIVHHSELLDADISARAIYSIAIESTRDIPLGTGSGTPQTYVLPHSGVILDTLQVQVDGQNVMNFYFDTQNSCVELTASSGSSVTASYSFDRSLELELEKTSTEREGSHYVTRFFGENNLPGYRRGAVVISLSTLHGHVETSLPGTGSTQKIFIPHKAENLSCTENFSFDEDRQMLTTLSDGEIKIAYDWRGDIPKVFDFIAAFGN